MAINPDPKSYAESIRWIRAQLEQAGGSFELAPAAHLGGFGQLSNVISDLRYHGCKTDVLRTPDGDRTYLIRIVCWDRFVRAGRDLPD